MWLLRNEDKGLIFRVVPGKQNIVSRKDADLLLVGDQSISRKHAELRVQNENQDGGIVLKDLGSKYGTFAALGGGELTQAAPNQSITLNNGDTVRFGIQSNIWRVEFFPLVVATSTLHVAEKTEVKEVVAALGGEVVSDWKSCCTHLTMNNLTVTVKVVCALACAKPIVVPGYWKALKEALASTETKLPDYSDFVPPLVETLLNPSDVSFSPNPARGSLFTGYTFVAASPKQLNRIKPMITAAGGVAVEFSASSWTESKLMQDKIILMQHSAADKQGSQHSQIPEGYIAAARKLKAAGVRCVPESEIGLCVLYCNMAQFCNPKFNSHSLFGNSSSESTQHITVMCPNTQESMNQTNGNKSGSTSSKKRALEDSSGEESHPSKRTNSEDLFSCTGVETKTDNNSNIPPMSLNKSDPKAKPSVVNPSLDMFAPSGQISGVSSQNKNTLNKSKSNNVENISNNKRPTVAPSLDMFASSGQISKEANKSVVGASCQDMFVSNNSRQSVENKRKNENERSVVPNKQFRMAQVEEQDDDFYFTTNNNRKNMKKVAEKDDEFSFSATRRSSRRNLVDQDDGDEFSFNSNKKDNNRNKAEEKSDDVSFVSNKHSKKRSRQSNPDIFEVSNDSLVKAGGSNMKISSNITNAIDEETDDFDFTTGPTLKKRKDNSISLNSDDPDTNVKLALFSKTSDPDSEDQKTNEFTAADNPPEERILQTYSKEKSCAGQVKQEVLDEEIDELARELQNATVVVVKPLVVGKQKLPEVQATNSGKNFKKFRKVATLNKRLLPHIIGGSDLVRHNANCHNIDDILPPSPPRPVSPEDDWGFGTKKRKGKN